ncbi:TRAP transporter substrate-binding protein [Rhodopila sp.]|uniref:TRAP transporter substrate-binding protein n=1 Tax=Rhodopila sp. TaxID=2480087 RepID=UPI003D09CD7B
MRIGVVTPLAAAPGQACRAFADAVAATPVLDNAVQVEVHANGELGGEVEMVKACAAGALDLVFAVSNVVAGLVPALGLLDTPFLFRDAAHARSTLDGPIGQEYADLLLAANLQVLAWGENGTRHVTANKPVRAPADLHGLHIRVPQSEVMVEGFRVLGAMPETLPFPQLFEALRTGRFDAQENPVATIAAAHLDKVQRCLSLTGHAYSAAFFLASSDLLEDLDDAQRTALKSCASIGAAFSRETASRGERDGVEQLRAGGMTIVEDVDRAALAAASAPALQAAGQRFGPDRVARIRGMRT